MLVDAASLDPKQAYFLMTSCVVPRPIAWVSTLSAAGVANAAPFSYFQALSSNPPTIMISVGLKREGDPKDTRANILGTGEFVVNLVGEASGPRMVESSRAFPAGVSEFEEVGFHPAPSSCVKPPRIAESPVSLECRHARTLEIGNSAILLGEVLCFHLSDDVLLPDGTVDPWKLKPLGRLGGKFYAPLREVVEIAPDGTMRAHHSELLDVWVELRDRTIAMTRRLEPDWLARVGAPGAMPLGRTLRHLAGCTQYLRLLLDDRADEDEIKEWDVSWTPERIAAELESDRDAFVDAMLRHLPVERGRLRRMIRHEAWHQGQIAATLRDVLPESELWRS